MHYDALTAYIEAVCNAGGAVGISMFQTLRSKAVLQIPGQTGNVELLSQLTIVMGDVALNSTCERWRYSRDGG